MYCKRLLLSISIFLSFFIHQPFVVGFSLSASPPQTSFARLGRVSRGFITPTCHISSCRRLRGVDMTGAAALQSSAAPALEAIHTQVAPAYEVVCPDGKQHQQGSTDIKVEAFLFDCDGTLVNSMPMWAENWDRTCKAFGLDFDKSFLYRHAGKTVEETLKILCKEQGKEVDAKAFFATKEQIMAEILGFVKEITPVADIARQGKGVVRMAVVSSGPREIVEKLLHQTGLEQFFEFYVCAEDVKKHKPHPEPFLLAAQKLGVHPSLCRVFEDADAGITAGRAAKMQTVDVRKFSGYPDEPVKKPVAAI